MPTNKEKRREMLESKDKATLVKWLLSADEDKRRIHTDGKRKLSKEKAEKDRLLKENEKLRSLARDKRIRELEAELKQSRRAVRDARETLGYQEEVIRELSQQLHKKTRSRK